MKLIRFTLTSLSPGMLLNPATLELLEALRTKKQAQKRTDWTVEQEAGTKLYRSEHGRMGIPTQNLMACIVNAGQHVKSGKKSLSTAKSTQIFDFLEFVDDFCEFLELDDKGNVEWKPFLVKGTMHAAGKETAVCITRPRIPHWKLAFNVKFDENREVSDDTVVKLVEVAGRKIGLCDWRPQKKGRFGRFIIAKIETFPFKEDKQVVQMVNYTESDVPADLKKLVEA